MQPIRIIIFLIAACLLVGCKTTAPLDAYQGFTDQQLFQQAEQNMQKKNYETAVKDFEALDTLYPFGQYSQRSQLDIINAYYKSGDNESALAAADRYLRLYPRADNVDAVYYLKGVVNSGPQESWFSKWLHAKPAKRDVSSQEIAFQDFNTLVQHFPNSKYAPEARRRMAELRNLIAESELGIAQYYMKRKIYIAAVNRATQVIQNYSGSTQASAALNIMIQSYSALNEPDLANDALHTLLNKYPNSKEAKQLSSKQKP